MALAYPKIAALIYRTFSQGKKLQVGLCATQGECARYLHISLCLVKNYFAPINLLEIYMIASHVIATAMNKLRLQ